MNNFAVLTIAYTNSATSILISITTNNPSHLTCYYTFNRPLRHKTTRTERGIALPWGAYFCFNAWHAVEQNEPGDTLTHTFLIPDLVYCQTIYFAFRGTVADQLSPSVSPIFHKHFVPVLAPTFVSIKDNYINAHWFSQHRNYGALTWLSVIDYLEEGTERIGLLSFDISSLAGQTLIHATLKLTLFSIAGIGNTHWIYRLFHNDWSEFTSSYNLKATASPWNSGDFSATDFSLADGASAIVPPGGAVEWDITALAQHALDNTINLNLLLLGVAPELAGPSYCSRQHADPTKRPLLTLTHLYTPP